MDEKYIDKEIFYIVSFILRWCVLFQLWYTLEGGWFVKLKLSFERMELDNQIIAVPIGENVDDFRGVIKMNETAAKIFELLKNDTTEKAIIDALMKEYEVPEEDISEDVRKYISEFEAKGLLE